MEHSQNFHEEEVEDLSESSDDEPAEDYDRISGDDGLSNMDVQVDPITSSQQLQTETGDISITINGGRPKYQWWTTSNRKWNRHWKSIKPNTRQKRMRSEQETSP